MINIGYINAEIKKICKTAKATRKHLPNNIPVELLYQRLLELAAFENLDDIPGKETPPLHFHKLS